MSKSSANRAPKPLSDADVAAYAQPDMNKAFRSLATEVQERRALDAKRRCDNCVHYDRPTDADPWPSCTKLAVGVDPDWFCADWEEPK